MTKNLTKIIINMRLGGSRMQPPTVREVIKRLLAEGWVLVRYDGTSHRIFRKTDKLLVVAGKDGDHMKRGTYSDIKRKAGW